MDQGLGEQVRAAGVELRKALPCSMFSWGAGELGNLEMARVMIVAAC